MCQRTEKSAARGEGCESVRVRRGQVNCGSNKILRFLFAVVPRWPLGARAAYIARQNTAQCQPWSRSRRLVAAWRLVRTFAAGDRGGRAAPTEGVRWHETDRSHPAWKAECRYDGLCTSKCRAPSVAGRLPAGRGLGRGSTDGVMRWTQTPIRALRLFTLPHRLHHRHHEALPQPPRRRRRRLPGALPLGARAHGARGDEVPGARIDGRQNAADVLIVARSVGRRRDPRRLRGLRAHRRLRRASAASVNALPRLAPARALAFRRSSSS